MKSTTKLNFRMYLTVLLIFTALTVEAQVTIGDLKEPEPFSLLELVGNKGLRLPQVNSAKREILEAQFTNAGLSEGLLIYNTSCGCMEYWNGEEWISLCQASHNPAMIIDSIHCSKIRLYGQYYLRAPLGSNHRLVLPLMVTKKGAFNLVASAGNGYYFQKSGFFDETGFYEITLDGYGTPSEDGIDTLLFTCNGDIIASYCPPTIVNVQPITTTYSADCDNIIVMGEYKPKGYMSNENVVKVPVEVHQIGISSGISFNLSTDMVNGMRFTAHKEWAGNFTGADTLMFYAMGSPQKAGIYRYSFSTDGGIKTTCSFTIDFVSTLGQFENPACKCLDIYDENPTAENGEYWLTDCESPDSTGVVKTYCDIQNGGWTLVWSYSEYTARYIYTEGTSEYTNSMAVYGGINDDNSPTGYSNFKNKPFNRCTQASDTINYFNYRLNRDEWKHFPNSVNTPQLKVRVTESPTDMYDQWALNNYAIISPQQKSQNPIETAFSTWNYLGRVPAEGKVFGKKWGVKASGGGTYGGWSEFGNHPDMALWNNGSYCTHWNFGNLLTANNHGTLFQVIPNKGGANNQISFSDMNNMFGWFGEIQPNHHFGKCVPYNTRNMPESNQQQKNAKLAQANLVDDFDFGNSQSAPNNNSIGRRCDYYHLFPHTSINNGQGRIIQWFVR